MNNKILFLSVILVIINTSFILSANYPSPFIGPPYSPQVIVYDNPEVIIHEYDCNGCLNEGKCYNIGTRLTIPLTIPKKDLGWRNVDYFYCGETSDYLIPQEIIGETCKNDFECQSNDCKNRICQQEPGFKIVEVYNDNVTLIENLLFENEQTFIFRGIKEKYEIGFGENDTDFVFFLNNMSTLYRNKTLIIDNHTHLILNSILFDENLIQANVTFLESENLINDSKKLIKELTSNGLIGDDENSQEEFSITGKIPDTSNNKKIDSSLFYVYGVAFIIGLCLFIITGLFGLFILKISKINTKKGREYLKNMIYAITGGIIAVILLELRGDGWKNPFFYLFTMPMHLSLIFLFILFGFWYLYLIDKLFDFLEKNNSKILRFS